MLKKYSIAPDDEDSDGICESQSTTGADDLSIDGDLATDGVATMDFARRLVFESSGDESGTTITIVGTDADGKSQEEELDGPNATSVDSTLYFKTVTKVSTDAALAGNVTLGTTEELATKTVPLNAIARVEAAINVIVSGTIDYTVQETLNDVLGTEAPQQDVDWSNIETLEDETGNAMSIAIAGATAVRLVTNSYSSGASIEYSISQPRVGLG